MSGLGGWFRQSQLTSAEQLLNAFQSKLGPRDTGTQWRSGKGALVVRGPAQSTVLGQSGAQTIAISGRARWHLDNSIQPTSLALCNRFLENYRTRGADALRMLKGDFALAVIDSEADEVLLAIDRMGVRSLVYEGDDRGIVFGSSCDVVRTHPDVGAELDPQAIYDYTYFHVIPAPRTIFRNQKRLLPGHYLSWSRGQCVARCYWSMQFHEEAGSITDFKPAFRNALREAVDRAADTADCGAFLSGGTDSSTVTGLLALRERGRAKTYSIGFAAQGYDEMEYARIAARQFGTEHHEYYVTPEDVIDALPSITAAYDQPFGNASAVPAYYCARLAQADGVTRMLAGDGGDELFGGNSRYAKQYQLSLYEKVPGLIRKILLEPVLRAKVAESFSHLRRARSYIHQASKPMPARYESYNLIEYLGASNVFTPDFLSQVDVSAPFKLLDETYQQFRNASLINQMLGIDLKFTLADSDLPKVTRMCELAGVEVAFPLLDEAVVDFSARLPANLKLRGTRLRYFFKEALRDLLPEQILTKQKHGFGLPVGIWITENPALHTITRDALSSLKKRGIIAPEFIDRLLGQHLRTHAGYFGTMAWVLMMLEFWFQRDGAAVL